MRNNFIIAYLIVVLCYGSIQAQRIVSKADLFKDGDRVCFIGNSITHSGSYHSLVYLFYLTRFPERKIDVFNCGISGDNVERTLKRFNKDIAVHKPSIATIKLGTNDINRSLYVNSTPAMDTVKMKTDAIYKSNIKELVRKLDSIHTKIIFLTPAYYEEKPMPDLSTALGLNKGFEKYGLFLDSLRVKYKSGIVDFHQIMDSISIARQLIDSEFTLNRMDRIHPENSGHFVMAYGFLKALNVSPFISKAVIDIRHKKVLQTLNCKVSGLKIRKNEITYRKFENSLPFPVSAYPKDTTLVPFTQLFNREMLQIKGLIADKKYMLTIDTIQIAEFTGKQLQSGINLALLPNTPQAIQAEKIAVLNEKRRQAASDYRDIKLVEYNNLTSSDQNPNDVQLKETLEKQLKNYEGRSSYGFWKSKFANYIVNASKQNDYLNEIEKLVEEIYRINKPNSHTYSIKISE
jgi:endoglucanase